MRLRAWRCQGLLEENNSGKESLKEAQKISGCREIGYEIHR